MKAIVDIGSADYYALYPKGWIDYKDNFRTRLSLEFFSPVIADNYRETSLPWPILSLKPRILPRIPCSCP